MNLKTIALILSLTFLSCSPSWAVDYCSVASNFTCWLMLEGSGTTIADDGNDGTQTMTFRSATNDPAWAAMAGTSAPTYLDYMVTFDGDDGTTTTAMDMTGFSGVTDIGWVIHDSSGSDEHSIFSNFNGSQASYTTRIDPNNDDWDGILVVEADTNLVGTFNDTTLTANVWFHVTMTYDGDDMKGYVDGVVDTTVASNSAGFDQTVSNVTTYLGYAAHTSSDGLTGSLGEHAIFDDALDSTDINDIMDNGLVSVAAGGRTRRMF